MNENELAACVRRVIEQYFADLDGEIPSGIYDMVLACIERPLLEVVLDRAGGNQTQAAEYLGMNRHTLRKKLLQHGVKP